MISVTPVCSPAFWRQRACFSTLFPPEGGPTNEPNKIVIFSLCSKRPASRRLCRFTQRNADQETRLAQVLFFVQSGKNEGALRGFCRTGLRARFESVSRLFAIRLLRGYFKSLIASAATPHPRPLSPKVRGENGGASRSFETSF